MRVCRWILACTAIAADVFLSSAVGAEPEPYPVITAVQVSGTNMMVTVHVPEGVRRITLAAQNRLGRGGWLPRVVCHMDGRGGDVRLTVPRLDPSLVLRVSAEDDGRLPAEFYQGVSVFDAVPVTAPAYGGSPRWFGLDILAEDGTPIPPTTDPGAEPRDVVESDIWKRRGNRLYFFNQYRGLQVIDVADPDRPALLGALEMPASGEQMYLLDDRHVALLVRSRCGYGPEDGGSCVVVNVESGVPVVAAVVPVSGDLLESRLVGTALYVASAGYRPVENGSTWAWKTVVASIDLSDPVHPVPRQQLSYAGFDPVFIATDRWLFAALRSPDDYRSSVIHAINIASPTGAMWEAATLPVAGQIPDQFKMQLRDNVFTVIYEIRSDILSTRLETYRFLGVLGFWRLGTVELARGERLFATRFDGSRVYIVTFEQIDPLWVLDLSDPRRPAIVGELEVPGFSTYIHPLGDQLLTVGREGSHVAVSLFGVADPARPLLLDRVLLGEESWWSTSEATFDEKAFGVLEEEGLILVPVEYTAENRRVTAVQIVDLLDQGLVERGRIEHGLRARRATVVGERVVSVSGRELVVVNVSDRDDPVVTAALPLAWAVNRIFGFGNYLVELAAGAQGYGLPEGAVARIASAGDPDDVLAMVSLGDLPVVGASQRNGRLYLAQAETTGYPYDFPVLGNPAEDGGADGEPEIPRGAPLTLSVYDLSRLPEFEPEGKTETILEKPVWGALEALWPDGEVLVWNVRNPSWPMWRVWGGMYDVLPWYGSPECRLLAFDVRDPSQPVFGSDYVVPTTYRGFHRSDVFADASLVLTSRTIHLDEGGNRIRFVVPTPTADEPVPIAFSQIYSLDVIDYEDPREPTLRPPVPLPGLLSGVSLRGNLLYTVSNTKRDATSDAWTPVLDALAYDGIGAYHVDRWPLPDDWTGWVRVVGESVILGLAAGQDTGPSLLATTVNSQGDLTINGRTDVASAVYDLGVVQDLVVGQAADQILVYRAEDLPDFRLLGAESLQGCMGFDLRHAHGATGSALWIPMGDYGVQTIPVSP